MTELKDRQAEGRPRKKYLWFGFGNYGTQPFQQIGGGAVRDPSQLENLYKTSKAERSQFPYSMYIAVGIVMFTLLTMLLAWVLSLFAG